MIWHDNNNKIVSKLCSSLTTNFNITISIIGRSKRSFNCPDPVCFDKVDLLLVAPWFGLSPSSTLMCPSTQVDKCWYGDWIYIGLVASGGTQQSLFYWKIYDPQTWRYSDLTLTLSSLTSQATLQSQLSHYHGSSIDEKKTERKKQSLFVLNLNSLVHISQYK